MADREAFYLRLPIQLQNLVCSIEGWRIQRSRNDSHFWQYLAAAEARSFWPVEQIVTFRNQRLAAFVRHCAETVPHYRKLFHELGASPGDIRSPEDLQLLPILTKAVVQERSAEFISEAVPTKLRRIAHTSGTTGGGLHFIITPQSTYEQWSIWWRYRRWHGLQPGTWCGYFGGRSIVPLEQTHPPFWRYNYPGQQIMFSAYHMNPAYLPSYITQLRTQRPPWLHGYPSLLALLAGHILETGDDLGYTPQWITIGAESLLPYQAELMERAFGVRHRQHYGMAEAVANISECERGALHVDEDFAAVEFIPNPAGIGYKVVGTNFSNPATPLLRYDIQDIIALDNIRCDCGRPGRVVASIDGRQEDYIVLKNGARLGRMDHIFKDMVNIREAQLHQHTPGAITIRVVRSAGYTADDESLLLYEARKRVGVETELHIEYVDVLKRSGTGKLRFVISDLPPRQEDSCLPEV